jgi:beta-glucosidase
VRDCGAIHDFHDAHKVTKSAEQSAAVAVKAGCDLNCGCTYEHIPFAFADELLVEADLDVCVERLFRARLKLGMFDPPARVPWAAIPYETNDCDAHHALARTAARESIVLLKNEGGLLPLKKDVGTIAVIGPNAYDPHVLVANYYGVPSRAVTPLDGIRASVSARTRVLYTDGCARQGTTDGAGNLSEAVSVAARADVVVLCLGLSAEIEGEQGDANNSEAAGDKIDLKLPGLQQQMMELIVALGKPTVLCVLAGSALDLTWAQDHLGAIVYAWYPGGEGGAALADVLFGDVSPAGRLPITFPRSLDDVPAFESYAMKGRTYRYAEKPPLYPFGYGLSYTRFAYRDAAVSSARVRAGDTGTVSATLENVGKVAGDEVVQLYVKDLDASCAVPVYDLRGFLRVRLDPGQAQTITFTLAARDLMMVDAAGHRVLEPGRFRAFIGGTQPDPRSATLTRQPPLPLDFEVF